MCTSFSNHTIRQPNNNENLNMDRQSQLKFVAVEVIKWKQIIQKSNRQIIETKTISTPLRQICDCSLSWLDTGTRIHSSGVKLVSWPQTSTLNEITKSFKCFPRVNKISIELKKITIICKEIFSILFVLSNAKILCCTWSHDSCLHSHVIWFISIDVTLSNF